MYEFFHSYLGTFDKINSDFGRIARYKIHIVNPTENGIERLSSINLEEIFSIMAPINAAAKPIKYSSGKFPIFGVKKTTIHALTKKANVPSRLFSKNLCRPNFLPIKAAIVSLIIKIENAVMKTTFGKISTPTNAEIRT